MIPISVAGTGAGRVTAKPSLIAQSKRLEWNSEPPSALGEQRRLFRRPTGPSCIEPSYGRYANVNESLPLSNGNGCNAPMSAGNSVGIPGKPRTAPVSRRGIRTGDTRPGSPEVDGGPDEVEPVALAPLPESPSWHAATKQVMRHAVVAK